MFRTTLLVGLASLTLATSVQALPKIEGSWPVAEVEAALAKKLFTEEQRRNSCNASGHCTRVFFSDEVGSRVDIAVKGDQVYRVVCVDECNGIWRRLGLSAAKIAAKPKPVGCYSYNSLTSLRGKVIARTGYGPDRGVMVPEPYFALMLDQPICTNDDGDDPETKGGTDSNVTVLQLGADPAQEAILRQAKTLGKGVTVTGKLSAGTTAHHHTSVMMGVSRVQ